MKLMFSQYGAHVFILVTVEYDKIEAVYIVQRRKILLNPRHLFFVRRITIKTREVLYTVTTTAIEDCILSLDIPGIYVENRG